MSQLDQIHEDRDVAEPFFNRLLERAREKHPGVALTMEDISITVTVTVRAPGSGSDALLQAAHRLLADIVKEGVAF